MKKFPAPSIALAQRTKHPAQHTQRFGILRRWRGFTIIELLVVLAIISLLISTAFLLLSSARAKARDARREQDMKALQDALALFAMDAATYPATSAEGVDLTGSDSVSVALISSGAIPATPLDPLNSGNYRYHYVSVGGFTYTITYFLETSSIPGKSAGQQQVGP